MACGGGEGAKGRNLGAIKLFSRGNRGGGIKILQSLRRAGIAVAVFMGKTQPSQCLSPPGIINGYRRIVREV